MLFESRENRSAIWNELKQLKYFNGFKASSKDEVRRLLDNAITMVAIQKPQLHVREKNSEVIQQMLSNRDLFVSDERDPYVQTPTDAGAITAEGMREMREQEFTRQLGRHQAEFDSIINQGRPESIDFSDKTQEQKIGGEMESLIARAQQMRQLDLESAAKISSNRKSDDVEKWINGGRPLKIEQESNLPVEAQPITLRKVRFSEPKTEDISTQRPQLNENDDIFSRLKTKQPDKSETPMHFQEGMDRLDNNKLLIKIETRLDTMESKLETILEKLLNIKQDCRSSITQDAETNTEHLS